MGDFDRVDTGSGYGYHGSADLYDGDEKIGEEAYKTDSYGNEYVDTYNNYGEKISSHYTDDDD